MINYFLGTQSKNTVADYQKVQSPEWAEVFKVGQTVQELDFALISRTHACFVSIFENLEVLALWARAFMGVPEVMEGGGWADRWTDPGDFCLSKQQTCAALAKKAIFYFFENNLEADLKEFSRSCKKTRIFFRGFQTQLAPFYQSMPEGDKPHPFQINRYLLTPFFSPGSQCGPHLFIERNSVYAWDQAFSIIRCLKGNSSWSIDSLKGLRRSGGGKEQIGVGSKTISRFFKAGIQNIEDSLNCCMRYTRECTNFSATEFYSDLKSPAEGKPLFGKEDCKAVLHLLRSGIDLGAELDTWQLRAGPHAPDLRSHHRLTLLDLICEFGNGEFLGALLEDEEDREAFRKHYATIDYKENETPYDRACLNQENLFALSCLIEESDRDSGGTLRAEIDWHEEKTRALRRIPRWLAQWDANIARVWRKRPANWLSLACSIDDVAFAEFLLKRALRGISEDDREAVAIAKKNFANAKGDNYAPCETPLDVALKYKSGKMVLFLIQNGADVTTEDRLNLAIALNENMAGSIKRLVASQKKAAEIIKKMRESSDMERKQIEQLALVAVVYQNLLVEEQENIQKSREVNRKVSGQLEEMTEQVNRCLETMQENNRELEALIGDLDEKWAGTQIEVAAQRVVERWRRERAAGD